ncbi:MAG: hypothetical protein QOK44_3986 [Betaproteobacteria bacterium]|nr:hypothetical protein [Betaproteobacteria bacterium]
MKLAQASSISKDDRQDVHVSLRSEPSGCTVRHALENGDSQPRLIAFDDLLWLHEFEAQQKINVHATRIPRRVVDLFVARGLVERRVSSLQLTPKGTRALQQLI